MSLPAIVIVGRPNVGKSSLLNCLARERISIVDARAGITRDRVAAIIEYEGRYFELVDTGGIGIVDVDHLEDHVETQINYAIARADLVLFVLDALQGIVPLDQRVAELLRKAAKPVLAVANKVDTAAQRVEASTFYALGFGEAVCVSASHGHGRRELLDRICREIGPDSGETPDIPVMKLAIVGKRNAGKSTLVNALAGEPRVIVSETPGTTRDAVDVQFEKDGRKYIAIDTAGVRKKSKMDDIDFYSYTRALTSIRRADVVMLLIDAALPVADVDQKLASAILEEQKPVLLAINKWDLARDVSDTDAYDEYLSRSFPHLRFAPVVIMTAREGRNVDAAIDVALGLHRQAQTRVSTARLNEAIRAIVGEREPMPRYGTRRIKIYYGTQVSVGPPTIVLFCNNASLVTENYRRFMENRMREILPFVEVPIRLLFRNSGESRDFARPQHREIAPEDSQTTADSD